MDTKSLQRVPSRSNEIGWQPSTPPPDALRFAVLGSGPLRAGPGGCLVGSVVHERHGGYFVLDCAPSGKRRAQLRRILAVQRDGTFEVSSSEPSLAEMRGELALARLRGTGGSGGGGLAGESFVKKVAPSATRPPPVAPSTHVIGAVASGDGAAGLLLDASMKLLLPPADPPWDPDAPALVFLDTGGVSGADRENHITQIYAAVVRRSRGGGWAVYRRRFEWDGAAAAAAAGGGSSPVAAAADAGAAARGFCDFLSACSAQTAVLLAHNGWRYDFPRLDSFLREHGQALPPCVSGRMHCTKRLFTSAGVAAALGRRWSLEAIHAEFLGSPHGEREKRGRPAAADVEAMVRIHWAILGREGGEAEVRGLEAEWLARPPPTAKRQAAGQDAPAAARGANIRDPAHRLSQYAALPGCGGGGKEAAGRASGGVIRGTISGTKRGGWVTLTTASGEARKVRRKALRRELPASADNAGGVDKLELHWEPPSKGEVEDQVGRAQAAQDLPSPPSSSFQQMLGSSFGTWLLTVLGLGAGGGREEKKGKQQVVGVADHHTNKAGWRRQQVVEEKKKRVLTARR